ncbi:MULTISPECIES: response regulator transcription factor [unclassified Massilia]|uniref:response regulator transcription factor n=1 Tax=unclassified Massilia TaxID=2609279 RepID=UPI0017826C85|nr:MULTISPECIES: response regulator [unclassified Massilia]MBD8532461.1 response regulator [Massilia sp. CFBP 13647]MBD8675831.1 response regulator [Massilia sp. CFBP 13721]
MQADPAPSVLVVEDDDHISQVLRFMLERQGYQVVHMADGRAAVQHVAQAPPPGLVLLDVMLPYVDGFEILQRIRATPAWREVPVLMLTAKSSEHDAVRALDAGANDFVTKPFQPQELLARVRRYLRPGG